MTHNTILDTLKYKSTYFYYSYKKTHELKYIGFVIIISFLFIILACIIFVFDFITDFIRSIGHNNLTEVEKSERYRLNTIARENAAASFGYKVGLKKYYQRQREIKEYNNRPWWDK